jgi:hypothetical protein
MKKLDDSFCTLGVLTASWGLVIAALPAAFAQASGDQAWNTVAALAKPVTVSKGSDGIGKSKEQLAAEIAQQAARSRQVAQAARDFYLAYPGHPNVTAARRIEAVSAIQGVEGANATHVQAALALGRQFRDDRTVPAGERFEVALAMDRLELSTRIKNRTASGKISDWKRVGDSLRTEFGDLPALQSYYMDVARRAETETAAKIAEDVLRSTAASSATKARAQAAVSRAALLGKPIELRVDKINGGYIDVGKQLGQTTVVVVWRPSEPSDLSTIRKFEKSIPIGTQFIYLALGGTAAAVRRQEGSPLFPGEHCHAPAGPKSRAASDALKLQYAQVPLVYVVNTAGVVAGIGQINTLPTLLQTVRR